MTLVADANAALSTVLPGHDAALGDKFLHHLSQNDQIHVPGLWHLETLNALIVRERRRRMSPTQRDAAIAIVRAYAVRTEEETLPRLAEIERLAVTHLLTSYDAAYLDLARRLACPLLSADGPLRQAAQSEGVPLL